ncbi:predicted protein [Nematostella vectensis]|uniref:Uncharacterized protein n=1 Tax=Nematostella vectensis TaxID=45351 RepID=A7SUP3_NEMVE|nr:predicted protein [Nematostella vectensis]|eukprot:XP_001624655.1 predicted protein [Nematostella vectensis]
MSTAAYNTWQISTSNSRLVAQQRTNNSVNAMNYYPKKNLAGFANGKRLIIKGERILSACNLKASVRDIDSVDEDILTGLCYAMELDKLYELPDLCVLTDTLEI